MISFEQDASPKSVRAITVIAFLAFVPLLFYATIQSVTLLTRAFGKPANIIVHASIPLEPISSDFYHAFAQGGEEGENMLDAVTSETKALSPKIIRIDHIYDHFDVVKKNGSNLEYNWGKLDQIVTAILSTGAKPMFALSYMPSAIAKDGVIINAPNDWNEWAQVVQKTVERYSGRGSKNLSGIYYEVWNEPDLAQFGSWKMGGEKSYLTLYRYAAIGASNAQNVNGYYLGGPSTTGLYKNWILGLTNSGLRVDFYSWHTYQADPLKYIEDQRNFTSWLIDRPTAMIKPTLITEFGITGAKSKLYDSTYAVAHTAAVIRQLISGGPKYLFSFELKDGPGQQSGDGWGLVTHQDNGKRKKARYSIYSFLDQMVGTRLQVTGEGSWVTGFASKQEKSIRLLLVNFVKGGSHSEEVPVTFTDLEPGNYTYKERVLFGRNVSSPVTVGADGVLSKKIFLAMQNVAILELVRE